MQNAECKMKNPENAQRPIVDRQRSFEPFLDSGFCILHFELRLPKNESESPAGAPSLRSGWHLAGNDVLAVSPKILRRAARSSG
jgi:hypothetical protein